MKTLEEYNNIRTLNQPYKCKLDDVFFFGKHKNKTIDAVLSEELSYLKCKRLTIEAFFCYCIDKGCYFKQARPDILTAFLNVVFMFGLFFLKRKGRKI